MNEPLIESLSTQINALVKKRDALVSKNNRAENSALVGRCYRLRNSYGTGRKWWRYICLVRLDGDRHFRAVVFEETSSGMFVCESKAWENGPHSGHEEISAAEFDRQWNRFVSRMTDAAAFSAVPRVR